MWNTILNSLKSFLGNFLKSGVQQQLKILMPIAIQAVKTVAADTSIISSSDKRSAAFSLIGNQIASAEKSVPESLINLALELGLQEIKALSK